MSGPRWTRVGPSGLILARVQAPSRSGGWCRWLAAFALGVGAWDCSSAIAPPIPTTGTATLWGTLKLLPHEGVTLPAPGGGYGDRALRDAELVDYSKPEFAVVALEGPPSPAGTAALSLKSSRFAPRFEPRFSVVGLGGTIEVRNDDSRPHVVSCPALHSLTTLAPGAVARIPARQAGGMALFQVDGAERPSGGAEAQVYVSNGPFALVGRDGRWRLGDVPVPGLGPTRFLLHAWHPRFPPLEQSVELEANHAEHLDLELQVR